MSLGSQRLEGKFAEGANNEFAEALFFGRKASRRHFWKALFWEGVTKPKVWPAQSKQAKEFPESTFLKGSKPAQSKERPKVFSEGA
jgi:hypothetical protein